MVAAVERGFCLAALPRDDRQIVVIDAASGETIVFRADPDLKPQSRLVVELSHDRRPARGAELSRRHPRRRHRAGQRPAAGRRHEQFQRADGRRVSRARRGQPVWPPATSIGTTSAARPIWPAIWARSRTGRVSARWRATAAWAPSAAARTTPPSSAPSRTTSANTPIAPSSSRRCFRAARATCSPSAPAAWRPRRPARRWKNTTRASRLVSRWSSSGGADRPRRSAPGRRVGQLAGRRGAAGAIVKAVAASNSASSIGSRRSWPGWNISSSKAARSSPRRATPWPAAICGPSAAWSTARRRAAEQLLGNQVPETVLLAASARRLGAAAASAFGAGFRRQRLGLGQGGRGRGFPGRLGRHIAPSFPNTPAGPLLRHRRRPRRLPRLLRPATVRFVCHWLCQCRGLCTIPHWLSQWYTSRHTPCGPLSEFELLRRRVIVRFFVPRRGRVKLPRRGRPFSQARATPWLAVAGNSDFRPNGPTVRREERLARWADTNAHGALVHQGVALAWENHWAFGPSNPPSASSPNARLIDIPRSVRYSRMVVKRSNSACGGLKSAPQSPSRHFAHGSFCHGSISECDTRSCSDYLASCSLRVRLLDDLTKPIEGRSMRATSTFRGTFGGKTVNENGNRDSSTTRRPISFRPRRREQQYRQFQRRSRQDPRSARSRRSGRHHAYLVHVPGTGTAGLGTRRSGQPSRDAAADLLRRQPAAGRRGALGDFFANCFGKRSRSSAARRRRRRRLLQLLLEDAFPQVDQRSRSSTRARSRSASCTTTSTGSRRTRFPKIRPISTPSIGRNIPLNRARTT